MFLIKKLDDFLKVGRETLEGAIYRVAQFEADEQGVSTTWLDVAGDGGGSDGPSYGGFLGRFSLCDGVRHR